MFGEGSNINGKSFRAGGAPGTISSDFGVPVWTPNFETNNWELEQWGFTLNNPGPYTGPFAFYFATPPAAQEPPPAINAQELALSFNRRNAYDLHANRPLLFIPAYATGGTATYGKPKSRSNEITGASSFDLFQP